MYDDIMSEDLAGARPGEVDPGSPTRTCANRRIQSMCRCRRNGTCSKEAAAEVYAGLWRIEELFGETLGAGSPEHDIGVINSLIRHVRSGNGCMSDRFTWDGGRRRFGETCDAVLGSID